MAIETTKTKIGENTYTVSQFPGREGFKIKAILIRKVAPALANLAGALDFSKVEDINQLLDMNIDGGMISKSVQALVNNLEEEETLSLIMRMLRHTRMNDAEIDDALFDGTYAGNYDELYKVLIFIIKYNNFFKLTGLSSIIAKTAAPVNQQKSEDQKSE